MIDMLLKQFAPNLDINALMADVKKFAELFSELNQRVARIETMLIKQSMSASVSDVPESNILTESNGDHNG